MKRVFLTIINLFIAVFLSACSPKVNPIDALPETTWQPIYVKGASNLKIPNKEKLYIYFDENLGLKIMGGIQPIKANITLSRKKFRKCLCDLKIELKSHIQLDKLNAIENEKFSEFQNLFVKDLTSANTIRLNANKLEFLNGKKLLVEFKRIPNFLGKKKSDSE